VFSQTASLAKYKEEFYLSKKSIQVEFDGIEYSGNASILEVVNKELSRAPPTTFHRYLLDRLGAIRHCEVRMLTATVSGSFHRHMDAINAAVGDLAKLSVHVLSPADPRIVAHKGEFLFVASDRNRSVRLVQDRHVDAISASDFLWLVCPDGYVGLSGAMEIGAAKLSGVPIFAMRAPNDLTLREYVTVVPRLSEAVRRIEASPRPTRPESFLIDPHASMEEAHDILERVKVALTSPDTTEDLAHRVYRDVATLRSTLCQTHVQNVQ
ncbi:MAG: hypothetical protein DMG49_12360, partial [Acidobacteria bacterium]